MAPDQERQRQQEASASSFSSMFDYTPIREQRVAGILADPANKESFALLSKQLKRYCKRASTRALFQQVDFDSLNSGELVKSL